MSKHTCREIEELLVHSSFDNLVEKKQQAVKEHLNQCAHCQKSQLILSRLKSATDLNVVKSALQPNPKIRNSLLKKIKSTENKNENILSYVIDFFNIKVPVYQILAVSAVVILMLIIFSPGNKNFSTDRANESIIASIDSNAINMNIMYQINIFEKQNIGRNIQEDSVLARFITPSM
ncbi:zf-HC2 domain-containing protein [Calditrichota bacterium]